MAVLWAVRYDDCSSDPFDVLVCSVKQEAVRRIAQKVSNSADSANPMNVAVQSERCDDGGGTGLQVSVKAPITRIFDILSRLYGIGLAGFVVDVSTQAAADRLKEMLEPMCWGRTVEVVLL